MNWINPKITLPKEGKNYLVLFEFNNVKCIAIATPVNSPKWKGHSKTIYVWESLHSPSRIRASTINDKRISAYKNMRDMKSHYFIETIDTNFLVQNAIAYISLSDIDYPEINDEE